MVNIEIYKICLVAKKFYKKEDIDHKETFSLISQNYNDIVDHFDNCFTQINIKIMFLNENIDKIIYTAQPKNLV